MPISGRSAPYAAHFNRDKKISIEQCGVTSLDRLSEQKLLLSIADQQMLTFARETRILSAHETEGPALQYARPHI